MTAQPLRPDESNLVLPAGFQFAGVTAGIKPSGKPDVMLVVMDRPGVVAGTYTTNQIVAAPVTLCRERTPRDSGRAVIVNAGNANACTGDQGMRDAIEMCRYVADNIGCDEADVLVMSTGVIGRPLPMDRVRKGIASAFAHLGGTLGDFIAAADAICTTDAFRKVASQTVQTSRGEFTFAAMCKGAGMIAPNMATMLGLVLTDAPLAHTDAQSILSRIVDATFNRVSVDGHTSTNDTFVLMSSGDSNQPLADDDLRSFEVAMHGVCLQLAKLLVADGEGAARFFEVAVRGAANDADAFTLAKSVAASPLVKTAIAGADPNWGRIVSAAGYAGPTIQPAQTCLSICGQEVFRAGQPIPYDAGGLSQMMKSTNEVKLDLCVGSGPGTASFWASDLTENYVRFNSLYTT